jgi:hypothetical protein
MMKLSFFLLCFFAAFALQAQGNLQFNQVIMVGTQQQTVPSGKVWKVNSFLQTVTTNSNNSNSTSCSSTSWHSPFIMNGDRYYAFSGLTTGSGTLFMGVGNHFPFWAPAGTTFQTVCSGDVLSIIEFNIVP